MRIASDDGNNSSLGARSQTRDHLIVDGVDGVFDEASCPRADIHSVNDSVTSSDSDEFFASLSTIG